MILVALAVVASTAFGVVCEHRRSESAARASRIALEVMLYALVPFVSFVNIAHLHLTSGGGVGLIGAYVAIATAGVIAWGIGRFGMRLVRPTLGAIILSVVVVNTGYLGLPPVTYVSPSANAGTLPVPEILRTRSLKSAASSEITCSAKAMPAAFMAIHGRSDQDE